MHFILSNYGEKYFGYVFACIYSIKKTNENAVITLLWQDMVDEKINVLKSFYDDVNFIQTNFNFSDNEILRMSSKNVIFDFAMKNIPLKDAEELCLLDVDMVILGSMDSYFDADFDIAITDDQNRPTPLNAGLFLAKYSKISQLFFERWATDTLKIFANPIKMETSLARPYSGIEQMSLWELIDYPSLKNNTLNNIEANGETIKIKKIHCKELNHIYNGNIEENTKVIHYKGVWNDFLINGLIPSPRNFQKYKIFGNTFNEALTKLNTQLRANYSQEFFNIRLHKLFYEDALSKYGLKYNVARNVYKIKNWLSKKFA